MMIRFLLSLCWVSLTWAAADPPNAKDFDSWQPSRMELQSKFSVLQAKLSKDSAKIVDEDQREALAFFASLSQFKKDFSTSEEKRFIYWNNESLWSSKNWNKGECIKQTTDKMRAILDEINATKLSAAPPFSKPDINAAQKLLNAVRNAIDLDKELQTKAKVLVK
jgi:hypothetical protein